MLLYLRFIANQSIETGSETFCCSMRKFSSFHFQDSDQRMPFWFGKRRKIYSWESDLIFSANVSFSNCKFKIVNEIYVLFTRKSTVLTLFALFSKDFMAHSWHQIMCSVELSLKSLHFLDIFHLKKTVVDHRWAIFKYFL